MKSISHTKSFEMAVPAVELFPLFSPEGEKYWLPGWDYQNLTGATEMSEDDVFLTETHDHGTTAAIWIVKRYDPGSHFVQFYKIEPGDKVGVVTVGCLELDGERTEVRVTYKYTALSAKGEKFIADFDKRAYEEFIAGWQRLLRNYFQSRG